MNDDTEASERTVNSGSSLARLTIPKYHDKTTFYDYEDQIEDYEGLDNVTEAINAARLALFKVTEEINEIERKAARSKTAYERAYRRYYLSAKAKMASQDEDGKRKNARKTETEVKMEVDIKCERLEDDYLVNEQYKSELTRVANALRVELQALQAVSNNVRQQMRA